MRLWPRKGQREQCPQSRARRPEVLAPLPVPVPRDQCGRGHSMQGTHLGFSEDGFVAGPGHEFFSRLLGSE